MAVSEAPQPCVGDVVEIVGLASKPDLNGKYAVVIEPESPEEACQLESSGRVKVTHHPNTLSLKPANVRKLAEDDVQAIDWTFSDGDFMGLCKSTISDVISTAAFVGCVFKPEQFKEHVWHLVAKGKTMPKAVPITDFERRGMLNNTTAHCTFFLALDQIAHHVVVETRAGSARMYQCYVDPEENENGDKFGFTAKEWVTGLPDDADDPIAEGVLTARTRWGGMRPINRHVLTDLLEHLLRLKGLTDDLARAMFEDVPSSVKDIETELQNTKAECDAEPAERGLVRWTKALIDNPKHIMLTKPEALGEPTIVSSSDLYENAPFSFTIPSQYADPFVEAYVELIGHSPLAPVYITALRHRFCNESVNPDPITGKPLSSSWGIHAAVISH